jgi:CRISPR/Cas system CMR subunit Cmr6 (Cas7 group RAMP superfamily)
MSIALSSDTGDALGSRAEACTSRSLFKDRFADPKAEKDQPKKWFEELIKKGAERVIRTKWLPTSAAEVHGRLMSRLIVDLSGGVMENANVLLDRYGLPYIPGSAVKGCARRMALQALHDWVVGGTTRPAEDDACAPCCTDFETPAHMLAAIARIFGWVEKDWDDGKTEGQFRSDFGWATGENHREVWASAAALLPPVFTKGSIGPKAWDGFPNFAGTIAFLSAHPNIDPGLELDVVTPHHRDYYEGKLDAATDTESPVPVYFPAVRPQRETDYFTFPLIPLARVVENDLALAKNWLAQGLTLFGLGGKTGAGYGWFDTSEAFQRSIRERRKAELKSAEEQATLKAQLAEKMKVDEERRLERERQASALQGLSPEAQEDWKLAQLSDSQFDAKVRNFCNEPRRGGPSEAEKAAIIRALKGVRSQFWIEFKGRATRGALATAADAIRALHRQLHGDKMP